jgi:hypothetical protein
MAQRYTLVKAVSNVGTFPLRPFNAGTLRTLLNAPPPVLPSRALRHHTLSKPFLSLYFTVHTVYRRFVYFCFYTFYASGTAETLRLSKPREGRLSRKKIPLGGTVRGPSGVRIEEKRSGDRDCTREAEGGFGI